MHEFSIALSIVEIAENSAKANGADKVLTVEVEVGAASGIVREALEFAWESAAGSSSILKHAGLILRDVPLSVQCNKCGNRFSPAEIWEACPVCGEIFTTIIKGMELKVISVTVESEEDNTFPGGQYA